MVIMLYINPLTNLNIVPFKFNSCWKFHLHKYAITLVVLKIKLFVSLHYVYESYFNFSKLTTFQHFSFNLMTNNSTKHRKVLEQIKFFCFKSTSFNTSRRTHHSVAILITKFILNLFACAQTTNHCCVLLSVYPNFFHIWNIPSHLMTVYTYYLQPELSCM